MNKPDWQPIETAPTEKECYLRASVSTLTEYSYRETKFEMYGPCRKDWCTDGMSRWFRLNGEPFDIFTPTHWTRP